MIDKKSIIGSSLAFILATSCCWLPALIVAIGGGTTLIGLSIGLESLSEIFIAIGIALLGYGFYKYRSQKIISKDDEVILVSTITCPECKHQKNETMPTNACQYFYECQNCEKVLKPKADDCCVYCSYAVLVNK